MNRWDDLENEKAKKTVYDQVAVEGNFLCQVCNVPVDAAVYLPQEHLLTYKCSEGHKSFIEKFNV